MKTPRQSIKWKNRKGNYWNNGVLAHGTPQQAAKRCQIILQSAEGKSDQAIAKDLYQSAHLSTLEKALCFVRA
jgi:hypothetical protein